jgi:hypothetical protein
VALLGEGASARYAALEEEAALLPMIPAIAAAGLRMALLVELGVGGCGSSSGSLEDFCEAAAGGASSESSM